MLTRPPPCRPPVPPQSPRAPPYGQASPPVPQAAAADRPLGRVLAWLERFQGDGLLVTKGLSAKAFYPRGWCYPIGDMRWGRSTAQVAAEGRLEGAPKPKFPLLVCGVNSKQERDDAVAQLLICLYQAALGRFLSHPPSDPRNPEPFYALYVDPNACIEHGQPAPLTGVYPGGHRGPSKGEQAAEKECNLNLKKKQWLALRRANSLNVCALLSFSRANSLNLTMVFTGAIATAYSTVPYSHVEFETHTVWAGATAHTPFSVPPPDGASQAAEEGAAPEGTESEAAEARSRQRPKDPNEADLATVAKLAPTYGAFDEARLTREIMSSLDQLRRQPLEPKPRVQVGILPTEILFPDEAVRSQWQYLVPAECSGGIREARSLYFRPADGRYAKLMKMKAFEASEKLRPNLQSIIAEWDIFTESYYLVETPTLGADLHHSPPEKPLLAPVAAAIALNVRALVDFHLTHNDLRPHNILFDGVNPSSVLLIDFDRVSTLVATPHCMTHCPAMPRHIRSAGALCLHQTALTLLRLAKPTFVPAGPWYLITPEQLPPDLDPIIARMIRELTPLGYDDLDGTDFIARLDAAILRAREALGPRMPVLPETQKRPVYSFRVPVLAEERPQAPPAETPAVQSPGRRHVTKGKAAPGRKAAED
ncbi:hypothetical protein PAPYR_1667 [Paratrimastix pyriformis]|uniref:Protein kinase domain-containing protein n=1 Tax=Paratrimastix pyriformis TaxID=342808 RepID=A0ABQ8UT03_9EUKA|nr:hypothetical protein PAPYR_1667 [Paratrimastix pyriformis]